VEKLKLENFISVQKWTRCSKKGINLLVQNGDLVWFLCGNDNEKTRTTTNG
jgi:hypothetical protein